MRALTFAASVVFFSLSLTALMEDAGRHKRSKIEPLTPATVLSIRSAKSSGYATIQFEISAAENKKACVEELWLAGYFKETKVGDIIYVFPDDNYCTDPAWPKVPTLVNSFLFCLMMFFVTVVQLGKYIDAIRASKLQARVMALSPTEIGKV
jgi:hypothetical protein